MKVCLDSRLIKKGDYFVPIKGDTFDGHKFIKTALENGAVGVIEENELYKIAKQKLTKVSPLVIAVAGAVGKTTFRNYLVHFLEQKYSVLDGYLNTKLGLATTLINDLEKQTIFVAELGIDRIGEMEATSKFITPNFVIFTKFEKEHLQFLKNLKTAVKENLSCIKNTTEHQAYINSQDKELVKYLFKDYKVEYFSANKVALNLLEIYNFPNHERDYLSCIYSIVKTKFKYSDADFVRALKTLKRPKGRLNLLKGANNSLILDDTYNSVCDSGVIEGLKYASKLCNKYKKDLNIVLSPMRETGDSTKAQHKSVAQYINSLSFKSLVLVGETGEFYKPFLSGKFSTSNSVEDLSLKPTGGDLFYFKGSQFYRLEKCVLKLLHPSLNSSDVLVRQDARWV